MQIADYNKGLATRVKLLSGYILENTLHTHITVNTIQGIFSSLPSVPNPTSIVTETFWSEEVSPFFPF